MILFVTFFSVFFITDLCFCFANIIKPTSFHKIACLMSIEHDEINVHVVAVQSQVIANILFMYVTGSSLIKRLIQVENIKFGIFRLYQYLQALLYLCANFQANILHLTSRYSEYKKL